MAGATGATGNGAATGARGATGLRPAWLPMIGRSVGARPTRLAGTPSWLSSGPMVGAVPIGAVAGATGAAGMTGTPGAP